jgi:hypothetical protein
LISQRLHKIERTLELLLLLMVSFQRSLNDRSTQVRYSLFVLYICSLLQSVRRQPIWPLSLVKSFALELSLKGQIIVRKLKSRCEIIVMKPVSLTIPLGMVLLFGFAAVFIGIFAAVYLQDRQDVEFDGILL